MIYDTEAQKRNVAWFLPRPKPDHYKGGMPLHAERWCLQLARDILRNQDAEVLQLFCGMNTEGLRVDIKAEVKPDIQCDVHELGKHLKRRKFDVIFADPPYSNEEAAEIYGTPKLRYAKWTAEATKFLRPGGLLIVYHKYVMPNPNPELFTCVKRVFIANRVYHLPRIAMYFRLKRIKSPKG